MKRCNYFSSLVVVFLMFLGMTLSAQRYMSSADASKAVQNVINQNIPMSTSVNGKANIGSANTAASYYASLDRPAKVRNLKVEYGKSLIIELNANIPVADAMAKTSDNFFSGYKTRGELDILQEVEGFYRNLLSR
jgi:hypothetical protein